MICIFHFGRELIKGIGQQLQKQILVFIYQFMLIGFSIKICFWDPKITCLFATNEMWTKGPGMSYWIPVTGIWIYLDTSLLLQQYYECELIIISLILLCFVSSLVYLMCNIKTSNILLSVKALNLINNFVYSNIFTWMNKTTCCAL